MPISNIVDRRTNIYDVKCDAIYEPSCHDNSIEDATQFDCTEELQYEEKLGTTVYSALRYADRWKGCITVFLYDVGQATATVEDIDE